MDSGLGWSFNVVFCILRASRVAEFECPFSILTFIVLRDITGEQMHVTWGGNLRRSLSGPAKRQSITEALSLISDSLVRRLRRAALLVAHCFAALRGDFSQLDGLSSFTIDLEAIN